MCLGSVARLAAAAGPNRLAGLITGVTAGVITLVERCWAPRRGHSRGDIIWLCCLGKGGKPVGRGTHSPESTRTCLSRTGQAGQIYDVISNPFGEVQTARQASSAMVRTGDERFCLSYRLCPLTAGSSMALGCHAGRSCSCHHAHCGLYGAEARPWSGSHCLGCLESSPSHSERCAK